MLLLVVDMQKSIVDEDLYAYDTFMERTSQLVDAARQAGVEVVFVQHDAGPGSGLSAGDADFAIVDQVALMGPIPPLRTTPWAAKPPSGTIMRMFGRSSPMSSPSTRP